MIYYNKSIRSNANHSTRQRKQQIENQDSERISLCVNFLFSVVMAFTYNHKNFVLKVISHKL